MARSVPSRSLEERLDQAASAALETRRFVAPIDVLLRIGWLSRSGVDRWRQGRADFLEQEISANLSKLRAPGSATQRDRLRLGHAPSPAAALQQVGRPTDRAGVPDALALSRAARQGRRARA